MDQNWQCCRERKAYFKLILILSVSLLDDMTAFRQFTHDENNWVSPLQKFMFNFSIRLSSYDTFKTFFCPVRDKITDFFDNKRSSVVCKTL